MADDDKETSILDDVRAAVAESAGTQDAPEREVETPREPETEQARAERVRDEAGRFATADGTKETITEKDLAAKPVEVKPNGTPPVVAEQPQAAKPGEERIAPPLEWKGAGKVKWDRLPREVQTEIRDNLAAVAAERAEVAPLKELIDHARPMLVREAGSVAEGFRQLIAFHELSLTKPFDLIQHIATSRGIDLRAAFAGQPEQGAQPQGQPDIGQYIAQAVQQHLQPYTQQIEQRETQQYTQTIEAFRADPSHPYFEDVKGHMAILLKNGAAKDLGEAYEQATWAQPAIRATLMQRQAEEADRTRKAEVDKARKASAASLTGSPIPNASSNGAGNPNASILDDVRAAAAQLAGA